MADPNLQQIPRGGDRWSDMVKAMFIAPEGSVLWERDYSGIEAVLVGYFAGAPHYIRLAKKDVHSFYTAYALNALGEFPTNDLPDINWPDEKLFPALAEIKRKFKRQRNDLYKHLVHGANYLQTAHGAAEHIFKISGKTFDPRLIKRVMGVYFELFPEIPRWHDELCERVDAARKREEDHTLPGELGVCYVRNPFGYVHRFYNVLDWEKIDGKWFSSKGEDAKRLVSFLPQSTAACIIKRAARELFKRPRVGDSLRLLIHDSIVGECAQVDGEDFLRVSRAVMEAEIEELPLDPMWGLGDSLTIGTEAKVGRSWGTMEEVKE